MKLRWLVLIILLVTLPTALYARWIKDRVVYEVAETGEVSFSHYSHLDILGKNCPTCHNEIFHIVAEKNPDFTMAQMEKGKSCGACHNGQRAFDVKDDCSICHPTRDIEIEVAAAGKTVFSHDVHTAMFGCSECHPGLFVPNTAKNPAFTMDQMAEGESCGACHDGSMAFGVQDNCAACHPTRDIDFKVPDMGNVTFSHDVHTGMFGCSECHPGLFVPNTAENPQYTMDQMYEGESCGACHDGSMAFSAEEACDVCHQM